MTDCPLTEKELNVIKWLADGHTVADIAELEHRLIQGIHSRITKAKNKTGAGTTTGLIAMAIRKEWIQ